jgi:8-oxo-dGTP pyrophosphatase MutT (NUDIX family)
MALAHTMNPRAQKMFAHRTAVPGTQVKTGVSVIVCGDDGRILLEQRSDCGMWGLLGGAVDPGESVTETAVREVREESGFDVQITGFVGVYSEPADRIIVYPDGAIRQLVDIVLEARITGGSLRISHESERLDFFALDQLPNEEETIPPTRQPLADFKAGVRAVVK